MLKKLLGLVKFIKNSQSGFSLTELVVTMSIVCATATVTSAQIDDILPTARDASRKANIKQVQTALYLYMDDNGQFPISNTAKPTEAGYALVKDALENDDNRYISDMPVDPLNKDNYIYKYWSDGQTYKIIYETEDPNDASPQISRGL